MDGSFDILKFIESERDIIGAFAVPLLDYSVG
jgi:hypothetical protein